MSDGCRENLDRVTKLFYFNLFIQYLLIITLQLCSIEKLWDGLILRGEEKLSMLNFQGVLLMVQEVWLDIWETIKKVP